MNLDRLQGQQNQMPGQSSMQPRQLPFGNNQPNMGQPQGGPMGGNAGGNATGGNAVPRGIPQGAGQYQKFGGSQTSQPNPMGAWGQQGGGWQSGQGQMQIPGFMKNMGMNPEMFQKLMQSIGQSRGQGGGQIMPHQGQGNRGMGMGPNMGGQGQTPYDPYKDYLASTPEEKNPFRSVGERNDAMRKQLPGWDEAVKQGGSRTWTPDANQQPGQLQQVPGAGSMQPSQGGYFQGGNPMTGGFTGDPRRQY